MTPEDLETYLHNIVEELDGSLVEAAGETPYLVQVTRLYEADDGTYYREKPDAPVFDVGAEVSDE